MRLALALPAFRGITTYVTDSTRRDGNIESLPQAYLYTEEQARAVRVERRGAAQVNKTPRLLEEIGVPGT